MGMAGETTEVQAFGNIDDLVFGILCRQRQMSSSGAFPPAMQSAFARLRVPELEESFDDGIRSND